MPKFLIRPNNEDRAFLKSHKHSAACCWVSGETVDCLTAVQFKTLREKERSEISEEKHFS